MEEAKLVSLDGGNPSNKPADSCYNHAVVETAITVAVGRNYPFIVKRKTKLLSVVAVHYS